MTRALALVAAFAATAGAEEPELRAVRLTNLDNRPALRVLIAPELPAAEVVREGEYVLIKVKGAAADPLALPKLEPPLEELLLDRQPGQSVLKVKVAPEVPFEASHEPGMLTVVFGEQPAPELRGPVTPELYGRLFPPPGGCGRSGHRSRSRPCGRRERGNHGRPPDAAPLRLGLLRGRRRARLLEPGPRP